MNVHDPWRDRLSEYLDGDLDGADRATLEEHLHGCADCRATIAELRTVVAVASHLEDQAPPRDLWPGVRDRIRAAMAEHVATSEAPAITAAVPAAVPATPDDGTQAPSRGSAIPFRHRPSRRISFTIPQLAAAGVALMLVTGAAIRLVAPVPGGNTTATGLETPGMNTPWLADAGIYPANAADPTNSARFTSYQAETEYDAAVADLERVLAEGRGRLAPATIAILEENLATIDRAIVEARNALAEDPANIYLTNYLADTMRRKLELLRYTNTIVLAQS